MSLNVTSGVAGSRLRLLLVIDADAEEAVGVRLAVRQGVVGDRSAVDAAAIRRAGIELTDERGVVLPSIST